MKINNGTLLRVPFDLAHWQGVAAEQYPNGLPKPIQRSHPMAFRRPHPWLVDPNALTARESPPDWKAEHRCRWPWHACSAIGGRAKQAPASWIARLSGRMVLKSMPTRTASYVSRLKGERRPHERLTRFWPMLSAQSGQRRNSPACSLRLVSAASRSTTGCATASSSSTVQLFHQRPFIWHIWDGRRDGFHALVNYHGSPRRTARAGAHWRSSSTPISATGSTGSAPTRRPASKARTRGWPRAEQLQAELDKDPRRRTALRHLRPLEAAARATHRLGAGHQRRRAHEHPPVHDRKTSERPRQERLHPARDAEDQVGQGPRQGAERARRLSSPGSGAGTRQRRISSAARTSTATAGTICTTHAPSKRQARSAPGRQDKEKPTPPSADTPRCAQASFPRAALAGRRRGSRRAALDRCRRPMATSDPGATKACPHIYVLGPYAPGEQTGPHLAQVHR